jgi:hypothetical protein
LSLLSDYTLYSNLDASTGNYQEEGEFYQEEEEENLENYKGKIILLQSAKLTLSKALPHLFHAYDPISQFLLYKL